MNLSQLSNFEYISLVANYNDLVSGVQNGVSSEVSGRGYTPEQLAQATNKISEQFNSFRSCGLLFKKPFGHLKFERLGYVLVLFENFERGCLPFSGSASEQPAQIMEIFAVLRQLKHEAELNNASLARTTDRTKSK